jgi:hypothetical protein
MFCTGFFGFKYLNSENQSSICNFSEYRVEGFQVNQVKCLLNHFV